MGLNGQISGVFFVHFVHLILKLIKNDGYLVEILILIVYNGRTKLSGLRLKEVFFLWGAL